MITPLVAPRVALSVPEGFQKLVDLLQLLLTEVVDSVVSYLLRLRELRETVRGMDLDLLELFVYFLFHDVLVGLPLAH